MTRALDWDGREVSWDEIKRLLIENYVHDQAEIEKRAKDWKMFVAFLRDKLGYVSTIVVSLENSIRIAPIAILRNYYGFDPDRDDVVPIDVMTVLDDELVNQAFVLSFFVSIKELKQRNDAILTITPRVTKP